MGDTGLGFADDFLAELNPRRWTPPEGAPAALTPTLYFLGGGEHALEVVLATSESGRPRAEDVRRLWRTRHGGRPTPVLLVVDYRSAGDTKVAVCGPAGDSPPLHTDLEPSQVERLAATALAEPSRFAATRFLMSMLPEVGSDLPGLRNSGLLAGQELRHGVPAMVEWSGACLDGRPLLAKRGRELVEGLGFEVASLATTASVLTVSGTKRAVAVFLDDGETFDDPATRFDGNTPISQAMAVADREGLAWVVLTRSSQIRVYAAKPDTGVGRKGREQTFVELNLALLPDDAAGYLPILAGADALAEGGTLDQIIEQSSRFAADLGSRLRDRVYFHAVPGLAKAIADRMERPGGLTERDLADAYEQTLVILFRLLFVAYGEDKDLLPYRSNGRYTDNSLKTLARRLTEKRQSGDDHFDEHATDLWTDIGALWASVDKGNRDWGVPAYNGGLFSSDPEVDAAGAALARLTLTNHELGPALSALLVDENNDGVIGPVDFRSLSVREFGTIYEGLLESQLSVAPSDLMLDAKGHYVPTKKAGDREVAAGEVYFHNRSGARKSSGSYFTKPFAVEHLLDHALEPALADHLERVAGLLDAGDQAAAADAFFDFRCVDLAMGSGHFLVAAIDRIEARLSGFLALHPIPAVTAELDVLRQASLEALGPLADGVEIETGSLLRRQVARRCIYGVDLNRISVELARLAIWIHSFVPGLPLSFLDHNLVVGNSLTGIGTLDEAITILDPKAAEGAHSLFRDGLEEFLGRASTALRRLAVTTDATLTDIATSREAHAEALAAVEPARRLFDLLVAARLGEVEGLVDVDEDRIATHPGRAKAEASVAELAALHFPIAFPEVFLRDNPGFDCILGNPPFSAQKVNEVNWWGLRIPGLKSMTGSPRDTEIERFAAQNPALVVEFESDQLRAALERQSLTAGQYPGISAGDVNLFKAFCWRDWRLLRTNGTFGVVLPYAALNGEGNEAWRLEILTRGEFVDVMLLTNSRGWVFDDVEHRDTFGLTSVTKSPGPVQFAGPFYDRTSFDKYKNGVPNPDIDRATFRAWSSSGSFPLLPSQLSLPIVRTMTNSPKLAESKGFRFVPYRELTSKERGVVFDTTPSESAADRIPVLKGESFDRWEPDLGDHYGSAKVATINAWMLAKSGSRNSTLYLLGARSTEDLPIRRCRIGYRKITRATDTKTLRFCLLPPEVANADPGQTLLRVTGTEEDEAYVLGLLNSMPLDWFARRWTDKHIGNDMVNRLPIPEPSVGDPRRRRLAQLAALLSVKDERFESWGLAAAHVTAAEAARADRAESIAEIDALAAVLLGLDQADLSEQFRTFHHLAWRYEERLERSLEFHSAWSHERELRPGRGSL